MDNTRAPYFNKTHRVVIKVGSSLLTSEKRKGIRTSFLRQLASQIHWLQGRGLQCLVVTSGAIAAGLFELGLAKRPHEIAELQALAAVGQSNLMHAYEVTFRQFGVKVAQILLTRDDFAQRHRYANAHQTLLQLFKHGIVPIINENDTVAVEEIKFGNNDTLGALVAHLAEADLLVILSDIDGFYSEDPRLNPKAKLISSVAKLDEDLTKGATRSVSMLGTGGMKSKIQAAKSMIQSGIPMAIANGNTRDVLKSLFRSEDIGTFFFPSEKRMPSKKRWLAWGVKPSGEIVVDDGAKKAVVELNKSLLPTGVRQIYGEWEKGDIVKITDLNRNEVAHGVANYSSRELELIKGLKSATIIDKLGASAPAEVVHKDQMVKIQPF